jgi:antitoxin CptB
MKQLERMRWRCRRGMLELDIVLGRFMERHYAELDAAQRAAFDALLDMPDTALWDIITGKAPSAQPDTAQDALLQLLRSC